METRLKKEDSMALKGVAILLMVFHHCYRSAEKFEGYDIIFTPFRETWIVQYGMYAKICVSIFAFVSGYGLMSGYGKLLKKDNPRNVTKWVGNHIISTMSGYWFVAPICYLVYGIIYGFEFAKWGESRFEKLFYIFLDCIGVSGILDTKSLNGTWWYIGAAVIFIAAVPILVALMERFGVLECLLGLFCFPRIMGLGFLGGRNGYSFLMIVLIGMLCCKYDLFAKYESWKPFQNQRMSQIFKIGLVLFLVVVGVWSSEKIKLSVLWEYKYAVIPFAVILFCVEYIFRIPFIKRVLTFLGKHSGNIWLTHTFVRDWLGNYIWSVKLFWAVPLIICGISIAVSLIINFLKKITGYNTMIQKVLQCKEWGS